MHVQKSVRVFVDNYFEQDKVQKEMASTSVKSVLEAYPVTNKMQHTYRDVMNVVWFHTVCSPI